MDGVERRRLGERLRGLRSERHLKQGEVARLAGVSTGTVQNIERGLRETKDSTLERVCVALGVTLRQMVREPLHAANGLLDDLNREDLRIAQQYNRASTIVRERVRLLLARRQDLVETGGTALLDTETLAIATDIAQLAPGQRNIVVELIQAFRTKEDPRE